MVAAYTPQPCDAVKPPTELMFRTRPDRRARIDASTARVTVRRPSTFTAKTDRTSSADASTTAPTQSAAGVIH